MVTPPSDLAVVGGGIVGLAVAMEAASARPPFRVVVIEKEPEVAAHQSSRNSGVLHSGVYYRPGSVRAVTCGEGRALMLDFLRGEGIPHATCGKVIVAAHAGEVPALHELRRRGEANGVPGLALMTPAELREVEPEARGVAALRVPGAAVVDFGEVARRLARRAREAGARIVTSARVLRLTRRQGVTWLETTAGDLGARQVINCAGLHSDRVAALAGRPAALRIVPFRGEYHALAPRAAARIRGLIYPVPDPELPFLGVHLSRHPGGGVVAGPNAVLALAREGYRWRDVSLPDLAGTLSYGGFWRLARRHWRAGLAEIHRSLSRRAFLAALRRLVPSLEEEDLLPARSGVRAQALAPDGTLVDDFRIERGAGAIHVLNVPSPAATASLAIARRIVGMAAETRGSVD